MGTVCWEVSESKRANALAHAAQSGGQGLPRIEVQVSPGNLPETVLHEPPAELDEPFNLAAILRTLGVEDSDCTAALANLWVPAAADKPETPPLIKDRPASFLMVTAAAGGQIDLQASRLVAVWIDGHEVMRQSAPK